MTTESIITHGVGGTTFVGPDATNLFRAITLKHALMLLKRGICPRRGLTMTKALAMCREYTGQTYRRTEADRALRDLGVWIETMRSAIPVERRV